MEKKEIYNILNKLSMIEEEELSLETFEDICIDLPALSNFVGNLYLNNDSNTLQKFLVCLLFDRE